MSADEDMDGWLTEDERRALVNGIIRRIHSDEHWSGGRLRAVSLAEDLAGWAEDFFGLFECPPCEARAIVTDLLPAPQGGEREG